MKLQITLLPILLGVHVVLINANHMQAEFSRSQQQIPGPSIGSFGRSTGNFDQSLGNFGQSSGNFDQSPGNIGQPSGHFDQPTGSFDQSSGHFDQLSNNFGQSFGQFDQSSGNFGQSTGNFGQSTENFGQSTGNFGQSTENFGQSTGNFGQPTENFGQSTGNFGRSSRRLMGQSSHGMSSPSTVEFFNRNLQLDNIMPTVDIGPSTNARMQGMIPTVDIGPSTNARMQGMGRGGGRPRVGRPQTMTPRMGGASGGIQEDPDFIRRILGSTTLGRELRMGELGLPRNGGAGQGERHANGMLDGWDGNPQTLQQISQGWNDPFRGQPIPQVPIGFGGNFGAIPGFPAFSQRLFR